MYSRNLSWANNCPVSSFYWNEWAPPYQFSQCIHDLYWASSPSYWRLKYPCSTESVVTCSVTASVFWQVMSLKMCFLKYFLHIWALVGSCVRCIREVKAWHRWEFTICDSGVFIPLHILTGPWFKNSVVPICEASLNSFYHNVIKVLEIINILIQVKMLWTLSEIYNNGGPAWMNSRGLLGHGGGLHSTGCHSSLKKK